MINQKRTKIIFIVVTLVVVFGVTVGFLFYQFGLVHPEQKKWEDKGTMAVELLRSEAANPATLHFNDIVFLSEFNGKQSDDYYDTVAQLDADYYFCYVTSDFIWKYTNQELLYTIVLIPKSSEGEARYLIGASSILDDDNIDTQLIKYITDHTKEIAKTDVSVFNKNKPKETDSADAVDSSTNAETSIEQTSIEETSSTTESTKQLKEDTTK